MTDRDRIKSLYQFLGEFTKQRSKIVTNYKNQIWTKMLSDIDDSLDDITLFYRDRVEEETDSDPTILKIHRPTYTGKCPQPYSSFHDWLKPGWDSFQNEVTVIEKKQIIPATEEEEAEYESFEDDPARVEAFAKWNKQRDIWVAEQFKIKYVRDLFSEIYTCHIDLERESETLEMVVACGTLTDAENKEINHPVLFKRVSIEYDALSDTIFILDTDVSPQLYTEIFESNQDINQDRLMDSRQKLIDNEYHPLDRNDTPDFLKIFIRNLSKDGVYCESDQDYKQDGRFYITYSPMFIVRKKVDGAIKALEAIVDDLETATDIPAHLSELVSGGTIDIPEYVEETVEEALAAVGGEDIDILLSKEANREQLEIARRIENYNAVLVQGPPGTGKTHTIANLMGHFLAQGKSVLVTSHTKKALSVLKDKLNPGIQSLCVSVLDDSNKDMEKSVDGITGVMGRTTSQALEREIKRVKSEREQVIKDLSVVRKKLYQIINKEKQNIVFNGESISPTVAAKYVFDNEEELSYIPGKIEMYSPLPLSLNELNDLYKSNSVISKKDEEELEIGLPSPEELPDKDAANVLFSTIEQCDLKINSILSENRWSLRFNEPGYDYQIDGVIKIPSVKRIGLIELMNLLNEEVSFEGWMKAVIIDGKRGGAYLRKWLKLYNSVESCCVEVDKLIGKALGKDIFIPEDILDEDFEADIDSIIELFEKKGKVNKMMLLFRPMAAEVFDKTQINGRSMDNLEDALMIKQYYIVRKHRIETGRIWDQLLCPLGEVCFADLDYESPELCAKNKLYRIKDLLNWYDGEYASLIKHLQDAGFETEIVTKFDHTDTDSRALDSLINVITNQLPDIVKLISVCENKKDAKKRIDDYVKIVTTVKRVDSPACVSVAKALRDRNVEDYEIAYVRLCEQYSKNSLLEKRRGCLEKISVVAPQWAKAISNRTSIHGEYTVPENIIEAWKWKQYSEILVELTNESYNELQSKSLELSKRYREVTSLYAEKLAWYYLLRNTEADITMKQALQGWKLTMKKIGKGTGKNAPMYRREARKLMSKCQKAVPAWIMPISKALESLDPKTNRFDVIIVDEASQSDISALAIAYMAKKLVIVGDDKQVSPMAVGTNLDSVNALIKMYLEGVVANAHLYTSKTSLYDIAATTFQPLMLREHFRCVPEIIGFSNGLSYDYKIKPLRDASGSLILPAVVQYRVTDAERAEGRKTNTEEGKNIVALMMACMEQPEYSKKSFGVIGMLGDEQPKYIRSLIDKYIEPTETEKRKLLCGNAANFQGDERDIIFLSLVDSNSSDGPLRLESFGVEDATRKRYNVAASRARDQLWVVHSLDPDNDLKEGDLRKRLIDYARNPQAYSEMAQQVESKSESPFERDVANYLVARGYDIVQQWKVGAYRLDIVVVYENLKIAIECDGEAYHSTDEQIRSDMERQNILERCGWQFIRIRGSEYYRSPDRCMESVIEELQKKGLKPQNAIQEDEERDDSELLQRVKARAAEILRDVMGNGEDRSVDINTISAALGSNLELKKEVIAATLKENEDDEIVDEKKTVQQKQELPLESHKNEPPKTEPLKRKTSEESNKERSTEEKKVDEHKRKVPQIPEVYRRIADKKEASNKGTAFKLTYDLTKLGLKFVDRSESKIIWVIYEEGKKESAEILFEKHGCKYTLEKRGALATGGVKAWRVIVQ